MEIGDSIKTAPFYTSCGNGGYCIICIYKYLSLPFLPIVEKSDMYTTSFISYENGNVLKEPPLPVVEEENIRNTAFLPALLWKWVI